MGDTIGAALSNAREALADLIALTQADGKLRVPKPRTVDELRKYPEAIEQMKEGAELREV